MKSKILEQDYKYVANSNVEFEKLRGCTILITGATGLIGSLLIRNLLYCEQVYGLNLKILGLVRNLEKAQKLFEDISDKGSLQFVVQDLAEPFRELRDSVDYIIHTASVTKSKEMVQYPADNIRIAVNGTMNLLDLAREKKVRSFVYVSSMEVYGRISCSDHKIQEDELGYLDLYSARSCYPEGKRLCECLCNAYAVQYGMHTVTARLAQTFGAGILPGENRVFAQFAKSVLRNEDIVLHTKGLSEGNYVYTADAISGLLLLMTAGNSGNAYNISNEDNHMTISQMANLVAEEIADGRISVVYDIPEDLDSMGYAPDVKMHLSSAKMRKLGWKPDIDMKSAYKRMIAYMLEDREKWS